jgi:DNA-binding protein YbaB
MTNPDEVIADFEEKIEAARQKAEQIREGLDAVRVTESTDDGRVTVTVNATGNVVDLRVADDPKLAQEVLLALRRAQAGLAAAVRTQLADTAPPETLAEMENQYRTTYPAPPEDPQDRRRRTLRIGAEEDLSSARPQPRTPRRPAEDPDYGDRNLLR